MCIRDRFHTGDDVYSFDVATPFFRSIWDAGGQDTLSVSNFSEGCKLDLTPGSYSSIRVVSAPIAPEFSFAGATLPTYDGTNNLGIAYGAMIENAVGGSGNDTLIGNSANNLLTGGGGSDTLDGVAGIDTAIYSAAVASYAMTLSGGSATIVDRSGAGTDSLLNVERVRFADANLALDVLAGNAGYVAKVIGVVFGAATVANTSYVGIGLNNLDGGGSYQDLLMLALNAKLGSGFSNEAEVNLLYQNLVGVLPSASELSYWASTIYYGQYTQASLAEMAAELSSNAANINLVGLAQTGLAFV